jgi:mono/diheme cytochrome c family protein
MIRGLLLGIVLTLLVAAGAWLGVVYGGAYDAAATSPGSAAERWTLETATRRSVSRQAGAIRIPVSVSPEMLEDGARRYAESCAQCHGAPGAEPADWSARMQPAPPLLIGSATDWSPEEVAWIVGNGIRMSGMPAFGGTLTADDIVAVATFVRELPSLSAQDYAAMRGGS